MAGAAVCAPASALPLATGATSSAQINNPMLEQIQVRRGVVRRGVPYRGGRAYGRRGGGIGPGGAAILGLGVLGVAAAVAASQQRERPAYYYGAQPSCYPDDQPVYDRYGNYRGNRQVQVCN